MATKGQKRRFVLKNDKFEGVWQPTFIFAISYRILVSKKVKKMKVGQKGVFFRVL